MLLMCDAVQRRPRGWHALIVILYDTCLYFRPQIFDNGATAAATGTFLFRDGTTEHGRRRLLALSSDVRTTANWTTKHVGVRVGVRVASASPSDGRRTSRRNVSVGRKIHSSLKRIGFSNEEIANI